ncbi:MAG: MazG-like family protein [Patescibacteria group bacterium]
MPDQTTTIQELRELVNKFRKERNWTKATAAMFAKDIAVEAGELLDHFVWDEDAYLKDKNIAKEVKYELVDVLYGVLMMSEALKIDLSSTLKEKLKILAKKYPAEQCRRHI